MSQEHRTTQGNKSFESILQSISVFSQLPNLFVTLLNLYSMTGIVLRALHILFHLILSGYVTYARDIDGKYEAQRS